MPIPAELTRTSSPPSRSTFSAVREASVTARPSSRSIRPIARPMPEEPPVTSADATRFDYLRNVERTRRKDGEPEAQFLRLLLSPECNGGSPAAVACSLAALGLPPGGAGLRRRARAAGKPLFASPGEHAA